MLEEAIPTDTAEPSIDGGDVNGEVDSDEELATGPGREGNSYIAEVTSERLLASGIADTAINVSFTEVGQITPL